MSKGRNAVTAESKAERESRERRIDAMAKAIRAGKTDRELAAQFDLAEVRALRKAMDEHDRRERSKDEQPKLPF